MTTLQQQAKALGDPTRHQVFRYLADADRPVGVAELTEHLGLNHNAIRQHLAKLVAASLVVEQKAPAQGRGRPRLEYRLDPTAEGRWGVAGPYERLSVWLTEVVRTRDTPVEVGQRIGAGRRPEPVADDDPVAVLADQMERDGFEPSTRRRGSKVDITLHRCPFASAAIADPDVVCALHLGIAQGVADQLPGLSIDTLVRRDPQDGGCQLRGSLVTA